MKSPYFDHIAIIFNPNSTGDAPKLAKALAGKIESHSKQIGVQPTLTPTKYAKHAQKLTHDIAKKYKRPLIISVSGDGGYNEVVNGAMEAKSGTRSVNPVIAVIGAGNANDHKRVVRDEPLIALITKPNPKPIDILHLEASIGEKSLSRYAHSYIGIGISPEVAVELNRHSLSLWRELAIIVTTFMKFTPFSITHNRVTQDMDSIIFANINEMAKVLKLGESLDVTDGKFELVAFKHKNPFSLLYHLFLAAVVGIKDAPSLTTYSATVSGTSHIQFDGEVESISARSTKISVKSVSKAIDALY